ncbi:ATP-grasp domain-containing protein [Fundidesulfovibrio agrisoli]|uniref:ATP-grasp domain-containing protein n=1 Tax=Fundidesulfovibrio agrisoli TaxID=2922717 RepID=UPI001FAD4ABC|nr:ATP-grasp domain-containing protein [Fundidesulfovibrio agrisoli]
MNGRRRVLILGGGRYYLGAIETARRLGYFTAVADRDPKAPGLAAAHAGRAVDIVDVPGLIALARELRIDAVVPLNDFGVRPAAAVSAAMGLPGVGEGVAALGTDKAAMRQRWRERGLPQPRFAVVESAEQALAAARELAAWPLVCKPADSRGGGSRGVSMVRTVEDLPAAVAFAQSFYADRRVMLEECVQGLEHSLETFTWGGRTTVLAVSDKRKTPPPYRVDTDVIYPSVLGGDALRAVEGAACDAVRALGLPFGPAHVELCSLPGGGTALFEVGLRPGGGHTPDPIVPWVAGVDVVAATLRAYLGEEPGPPEPTARRGCVYHFLTPKPGQVARVEGLEDVRSWPGILDAGLLVSPGDEIRPVRTGADRAGFVVAAAESREQALALAQRADAAIRVIAEEIRGDQA